MHQIQLSEQLYLDVQRRATAAGFASVDAYVTEVLQHDLEPVGENFDHLFTPERLSHIDRAAAEIAAGKGLTLEQVNAELVQRREQWLRDQ
jgi:hypothetical protein